MDKIDGLELRPNSHRYKESQKNAESAEKKEIKKVVKGKAKVKKKGEIRKFTDVFLADDLSSVKQFALEEVLIPSIKKLFYDIITGGADMLIYKGQPGATKKHSGNFISYNRFSDPRDRHPVAHSSVRSRFSYDDILFESRGEAEACRMQMCEVIDTYGFVTVADMYDMADLTAPYTSNKYGWTNISSADVVRARGGGYVLKLPKALPID